ncbi:MAG: hypothetical protein F4X66_16185 [Chloroflexi bacterium]|nr:hypothetical protein [Chloroflexota bacterium]MYE38961.1 hypothetical protein [Chloroflexota bacterium]
MSEEPSNSVQSASEQIFSQIEQDMEAGRVRDVWVGIRKELAEGGSEAVRTYLASEYQTRKAMVQNALNELSNQLEEIA